MKVKLIIPERFRDVKAEFFGKYSIGEGMKHIMVDKTFVSDFLHMGFKKAKTKKNEGEKNGGKMDTKT